MFWKATLEIYCHFCNQCSLICLVAEVQKQKSLHCGPKIPNLHTLCWNSKMLLSYLKLASICLIHHTGICLAVKFCEKMKMPKFGTQNALFGYFWARISKSYFYISNQHPRVCLIAKFREKNAKIWNQKCLIWVFSG